MTYLEYRSKLAALTTTHRAAVAQLHAEYQSQSKTDSRLTRSAQAMLASIARLTGANTHAYLDSIAEPLRSVVRDMALADERFKIVRNEFGEYVTLK